MTYYEKAKASRRLCKERYNCIKAMTKELRKVFKGIQANSYGYCCTSDYDAHHKYTNDDDYICCKLFKGGLNNDYCHDEKLFLVSDRIYFMWNLTNFRIEDVIRTMRPIARKYGATIETPFNDGECVQVNFTGELYYW